MIKTFKHKGLKKFFETGSKAGIQAKHSSKLRDQLALLHSAQEIGDMDIPGYRLHSLSGTQQKVWSIWVNGNWRMTFMFENGDAHIVNYEDYH